MNERVVYVRKDTSCSALQELGRTDDGVWGVCTDADWPPAQDLELLYISPTDYEHAMRRLSATTIAGAVQHRRRVFAAKIPSRAIALAEQSVRRIWPTIAVDARAKLLTTIATLTAAPRFAGTPTTTLVQYLREGDGRLVAECESVTMRVGGDPDPDGSEGALRRRLAAELGQLLVRRGEGDRGRGLPYFDVERVCWLESVSAEARARALAAQDPVVAWRGGMLMPVSERGMSTAAGHQYRVVYATAGLLVEAVGDRTQAQLEVEWEERLAAPRLHAHLAQLRFQQATLRAGVRLLAANDPELAALLARQSDEEVRFTAGRDGAAAAPLAIGLRQSVADTHLLASLCRHKGRQGIADRLLRFAGALSEITETS